VISFGGDYLVAPNVGVQGSRGAAGLTLLASLMAEGQAGMAKLIETCVQNTEQLADFIENHPKLELKQRPETAVVNWRVIDQPTQEVLAELGHISSRTKIDDELWVRQVAANPQVNIEQVIAAIEAVTQPI